MAVAIHNGYKASSLAQNKAMLDLIYSAEDTDIMSSIAVAVADETETEQTAVEHADYIPFPDVPTSDNEADESADIAAYHALLVSEDTTEQADSATMEQLIAQGTYTLLFTTNPLGDLPSTVALGMAETTYNGKAVRIIACPKDNVGVQRASSRIGSEGQQFVCVPEHIWLELQDETPVAPVETPVAPVETPVAPVETPVAPVVLTPEQQAMQQAQTAAAEAQAQLDELQKQLADLEAKAKLAQAKADEAAALVPVEITPDLRAKLDAFNAIATLDEQGIAKAFLNGLVWLKSAGSVRKDSGTSGKLAKKPSSTGVVEVHRNGSNGSTAVVGTDKTVSDELRHFIRSAKTELVALSKTLGVPWTKVKHDNDIARKLGYDPILYGKKIWNLRHGQHAEVHADIQ
jgi:hypothetical protein